MKFALASILAAVLSAAACGGGIPPTAPTPAPAAPSNPPAPTPPAPTPPTPLTGPGLLWVMALTNGGACVPGAAVEVIIDGTVVQSGIQTTPCDYWGYDGGILFKNLPVAEVTLRARAEGYKSGEITATPSTGWYSVTAIELARAN